MTAMLPSLGHNDILLLHCCGIVYTNVVKSSLITTFVEAFLD